jgi:hypothetical protein
MLRHACRKTVTLLTNGVDPIPVTTLCPGITYDMKVRSYVSIANSKWHCNTLVF